MQFALSMQAVWSKSSFYESSLIDTVFKSEINLIEFDCDKEKRYSS